MSKTLMELLMIRLRYISTPSIFPSSKAFQKAVSCSVLLKIDFLNHSWICNLNTSRISRFGITSLYAPSSVIPACVRYPVVNRTLQRFSMLLSISSYVRSRRSIFSIAFPAINCSISFRVVLFALSTKRFTRSFPLVLIQYASGLAFGSSLIRSI